jgi:hypothetical protein
VLMVPTFSDSSNTANTFFVNDLIDGNIFIRMKHYSAQ